MSGAAKPSQRRDQRHPARRSVSCAVGLLVLGVPLTLGIPCSLRAQVVDSTFSCLELGARVFAIARTGNTIYIGGNFATVGPATGGGVPINLRTATPTPGYPRVAGKVNAVVGDGSGGWYIGGLFAAVGGRPRANLAHITAAGTVDEWSPNTDGEVYALALQGQVLYVGGAFTSIGGQGRQNIAALSTHSDVPLPWNPDADHWVTTLLPSGPVIYAGGLFKTIGGLQRAYVAALDTSAGQATAWDAGIDVTAGVSQRVLGLAVHDTTLFVGGQFVTVRGTVRRQLAAVSTVSGALLPWDAGIERRPDFIFDGGPRVSALLIRETTLYVAGSFKAIGGASRQGLAALNIATAQATQWDPHAVRNVTPGASFSGLATSGDTLFVAGISDSVGGARHSYLVALSASTGARQAWDPNPNDFVTALALDGGTLYAGGRFTSVGPWVKRHDLAAFDATTGEVTEWAPEPDYIVQDIVVRGSTVYVGGSFSFVGEQPRAGVAALDAATGLATSWNPGVSGTAYSLAFWGSTLLVGGSFNAAGGQSRKNIAAIDTSTGLATSWNPSANDIVYTVVPADSVIYVGGWFGSIGGRARASLAALDAETGLATPWAPGTDGTVERILVFNGRVYVGGWFHQVGGLPRSCLAAVDASGMPTAWVADANDAVQALAAADSTIYAGGFFSQVGGQPRYELAALDARTGAVRRWDPSPQNVVWSLAASEGVVYAGGLFVRMGNWPQAGFAAFVQPDMPALPRATPFNVQNAPNPAREATVIRYSLLAPATVNLTVFDLQGRAVVKLLSGVSQSAGPQQASLSTAGWRPGCYVYRLEAGGLSATKKMVVLR
jgi:hypothetical protein